MTIFWKHGLISGCQKLREGRGQEGMDMAIKRHTRDSCCNGNVLYRECQHQHPVILN